MGGNDAEVSQALTDAESTGISTYILRMAIVQAGTEVKTLQAQYHNWMKDADIKMGKLIRGAEDAMQAQKKLSNAQQQLTTFLASQNEKTKKVLMGFLGNSGSALQAAFFKEWQKIVKDIKMENEIRAEFSQRMEHVQRKILEFKAQRSGGITGLMVKAGGARNMELLGEVFGIWRQDCVDEKDIRDAQSKCAGFEAQIKAMQKNYRYNMMKFLARMNNRSEDEVLVNGFGAWVQYYQEWKKMGENEKEDALAKERMAKIMAEKKDGTAKVLGALTAGQAGACV